MAKTKADLRREMQREELWPGSGERVWRGAAERGYWCAPRTLPLLLHLTSEKKIVGTQNCSTVYVELLSRDFGQGVVEIRDEDEHAFCAGYTGSRAKRTWQERIRTLEKAGFIQVAPKGNRLIGYILLLHPYSVANSLYGKQKISKAWWDLFQAQLRETGALPVEESRFGAA